VFAVTAQEVVHAVNRMFESTPALHSLPLDAQIFGGAFGDAPTVILITLPDRLRMPRRSRSPSRNPRSIRIAVNQRSSRLRRHTWRRSSSILPAHGSPGRPIEPTPHCQPRRVPRTMTWPSVR
jgi:hypothetical protein